MHTFQTPLIYLNIFFKDKLIEHRQFENYLPLVLARCFISASWLQPLFVGILSKFSQPSIFRQTFNCCEIMRSILNMSHMNAFASHGCKCVFKNTTFSQLQCPWQNSSRTLVLLSIESCAIYRPEKELIHEGLSFYAQL